MYCNKKSKTQQDNVIAFHNNILDSLQNKRGSKYNSGTSDVLKVFRWINGYLNFSLSSNWIYYMNGTRSCRKNIWKYLFFQFGSFFAFRKIIYYLKTLTIITRTKMVIRDHCNVEIVWKEKTHQSFSRSPPTFIKWEQYGPVWLACIICLTE